MVRRRVAALLWVALLPCARGVRADDPVVGPGAQVRVSAPTAPHGTIRGYVQALDEQALTVMSKERSLSIPRASITHLEVLVGRRRNWRKGAFIGGVLGAVTIVALCSDEFTTCPGSDAPIMVGVVGGYAAFGALVGMAFSSDRWAVVPLGAATPGPQVRLTQHLSLGVALRRHAGATAAWSPQLVVRF